MDYRINLNPSRNMSIHDLAVIKHPFLANLRRSQGINVEVKIKREEQAFEVLNYEGDISRLKTALGKAKGDTAVSINPKFIDITDEETPEKPPKTDDNLKYEIEVLEAEREVLEQMLSGTEIQLEEAQKRIDWFTNEYDKVEYANNTLAELNKLRGAQEELNQLKSEHTLTLEELIIVKKTNEGLKTSYSRKEKQAKELQSQLDEQTALIAELGEKKLDSRETSISFVRQCSNDLKNYERELAEIVGKDNIADLLKIRVDLDIIEYIKLATLGAYSEEDINTMLGSKPNQFAETKYYFENKAKYDNAKSSVDFVDKIVSSKMAIPEVLLSSVEKLRMNETEYRAIVKEFEEKEKKHKETTDIHNNIIKAREQFTKAQKVRALKENAPTFRICMYSDEDKGITTLYLPHGLENGYAMQSSIISHYAKNAKIDDAKSIIEFAVPEAEQIDMKKFVADIRESLESILPKIMCEEIKHY